MVSSIQNGDLEIPIQVLHDLHRLVGERVLLGRRKVPPLVMAIRQVVHGYDDAGHESDQNG